MTAHASRCARAVLVLAAVMFAGLASTGAPTATATSPAGMVSLPVGAVVVAGRPLAALEQGVVFASPDVGTPGLLAPSGGASRALQPFSPDVNDGAWGCASSFVGLYTRDSTGTWASVIQWRDVATGRRREVAVPGSKRPLGAAPGGWVYAEWGRGLVRVDGTTLAETVIAPYATSYACDDSGYAWVQRDEALSTEAVYRRPWSTVTATPVKLGQTSAWMTLLALDGTTVLWVDHTYDATSSRVANVTVVRGTQGSTPVRLTTSRGEVTSAVVTPAASTYVTVARPDDAEPSSTVTIAPADGPPVVHPLAGATAAVLGTDLSGRTVLARPGANGGLDLVTTAGLTRLSSWWLPAGSPTPRMVPVPPTRVMDTSQLVGGRTLVPGAHRVLRLAGRAGVPAANVSGVVLNVASVGAAGNGTLTVTPSPTVVPATASLSTIGGRTVSTLVYTGLAPDGSIALSSTTTTQVRVDVVGYVPAFRGPVPVAPARVLPRTPLAAGAARTVTVAGARGVPASGVGSVLVTLTASAPGATGGLTAYPAGATRPAVPSVLFAPARSVSTTMPVRLGTTGAVTVYTTTSATVSVDVVGYVPTGLDPIAVTPARLVRSSVTASSTTAVPVLGRAGVPTTGVRAVLLTLGVSTPASSGSLRAYASGAPPVTATPLLYSAREQAGTTALVPVGADGRVLVASTAAATLEVDVLGYVRR